MFTLFSGGRCGWAVGLCLTFLGLVPVDVWAQSACASPMKLVVKDAYVYMTGGICEGDADKFIQYMQGKGQAYKVLRLNNTGGRDSDAIKIGHYLRTNKLTTWTDGKLDVCEGACNRVCAGGFKRHYSRADNILTGKNASSRHGLGYHFPGSNKTKDSKDLKDPYYEQTIVPYLKEMLPAAAVAWIVKTDAGNATDSMVWLNGNRATRLGIATESQTPF